MTDTKIVTVRNEVASMGGLLWFAGWLFTIGYLHLHILKGALALVLWPFYLGQHFGK
jgi:hypothetical protein